MAGNSDGEDVSAMVPPKKRGAAAVAGGAGSCLPSRALAPAVCRPKQQLRTPKVYLTTSTGVVLGCAGEADPKRARGASGRAARAAGRAHEDEQSQVTSHVIAQVLISYARL